MFEPTVSIITKNTRFPIASFFSVFSKKLAGGCCHGCLVANDTTFASLDF